MGKGMDVGKKEQITGRKKERIAERKEYWTVFKECEKGNKRKMVKARKTMNN